MPAPAAQAAGGPAAPVQGGAGVSAPGGDVNYVTVASGRSTLVERVRRDGGVVERFRTLPGVYGVPGVGYDGSATGLSADGSTLVLAGRNGAAPTRLIVLDARSLRPRANVVLPGYSTVDAISPDGRWLYLIRYRSVTDVNHYQVRAYDLVRHRLLRAPVVDPREPDEKMQGTAVTRTMSPDGRWAYTLYIRPGDAPFIHALDTARRTAACIDLDGISDEDVGSAHLTLGGGTLRVDSAAGPLALVDTRTFAVRRPSAVAPARRAPARRVASSGDDGGGLPWALAFLALVPLAGLAVVARRWRHASSA
ncbi:MAG: hypothetical protein V7607_4868 [Solirubrobacteraceae bacterium]